MERDGFPNTVNLCQDKLHLTLFSVGQLLIALVLFTEEMVYGLLAYLLHTEINVFLSVFRSVHTCSEISGYGLHFSCEYWHFRDLIKFLTVFRAKWYLKLNPVYD